MGKMTKKLARENKKGTKNIVEKSVKKSNSKKCNQQSIHNLFLEIFQIFIIYNGQKCIQLQSI